MSLMQILRQLATILPPRKIRFARPLGDHDDVPDRLFMLLRKETNLSETELLETFYPSQKHGREYFRKAKNTLRERMLTTLLLFNPPDNSPARKQAFHRMQKEVAAINILRNQGNLAMAGQLATLCIKDSIRYDFTDITVDLAWLLRHFHVLVQRDQSSYDRYAQVYHKYIDLQTRERHVYSLYLDLANEIVQSKNPTQSAVHMATVFEKDIAITIDNADKKSHKLILFGYNGLYLCAQCQGKIREMITICRQATRQLNILPYQIPDSNKFSFLSKGIFLSIEQELYAECRSLLEEAVPFVVKGKRNWFVLKRMQGIYLLRTHQFKAVLEVLDQLYDTDLNPEEKQEVVLLEAFYDFFAALGHCEVRSAAVDLDQSLSYYKSDKTGSNTTAKVVNFLLLLARKEYDQMVDQAEALQLYAYRYLNQSDYQDEFNLIKALLCIPNNSFNAEIAQQKAEKWVKKINGRRLHSELDIIPLKKIWDYAISTL